MPYRSKSRTNGSTFFIPFIANGQSSPVGVIFSVAAVTIYFDFWGRKWEDKKQHGSKPCFMISKNNNYAFIDSQNVNLAILDQGWKLDFRRFRVYLREKYRVSKAFLFIGFIPQNNHLYQYLVNSGYQIVYKPVVRDSVGRIKGNIDAELVLHAMIQYSNYDKAVIVTGDGDFYCLAQYLLERNKLENVIIPNRFKYSALLKWKIFRPYLRYMNDLENILAYKKRTP